MGVRIPLLSGMTDRQQGEIAERMLTTVCNVVTVRAFAVYILL